MSTPADHAEPAFGADAAPLPVVVPHTGEILDDLTCLLASDLAELFDDAKQMEGQLADFRRKLGDELIARLDHNREWTLRDAEYEISAPSDAKVLEVQDMLGLRAELRRLVEEEVISPAAAMGAIKLETTRKPVIAKLRDLLKNPAIAARIEPFARDVPRAEGSRRVTVKRHTVSLPS